MATVPGLVLVDESADGVGDHLRFLRRDRMPSVGGVRVSVAGCASDEGVAASGEPPLRVGNDAAGRVLGRLGVHDEGQVGRDRTGRRVGLGEASIL
jgi:hypothetical protein